MQLSPREPRLNPHIRHPFYLSEPTFLHPGAAPRNTRGQVGGSCTVLCPPPFQGTPPAGSRGADPSHLLSALRHALAFPSFLLPPAWPVPPTCPAWANKAACSPAAPPSLPPSPHSCPDRRLETGWDAPAARPGQVLQRHPCPSGRLPLTWRSGRPLSSSTSSSPAQPLTFSASRILRGLPTTARTGSPPQGPPTLGTPPLRRPEYRSLRLGCATSGQGPFPPSTGLWPPATWYRPCISPGTWTPVCQTSVPPVSSGWSAVLRPTLPRAGLCPAASLPLGPAARCTRMRSPGPRPSLGSREQAAGPPVASSTRAEAGPLSPVSWQGLDSWHRACTCEDPLQERTDFHPLPPDFSPCWVGLGGRRRQGVLAVASGDEEKTAKGRVPWASRRTGRHRGLRAHPAGAQPPSCVCRAVRITL